MLTLHSLLNLSHILICTPVQIKLGFILLIFLSSWLFHEIWVIFTFLCFSLIVSQAFWREICIISVWNWISINYQTRWRVLDRSWKAKVKMDNGDIEGGGGLEDEFHTNQSGRKYRPVVAHDPAVLEMSSIPPGSSSSNHQSSLK